MGVDWKGQSPEENESVTLWDKEIFKSSMEDILPRHRGEQKKSVENHLNITEGMRRRKGEKDGKTEGKGCDQHYRGTQWPFHTSIWRKRALKNPAVCGKAPSVGEHCLYPAAKKVPGTDAAM